MNQFGKLISLTTLIFAAITATAFSLLPSASVVHTTGVFVVLWLAVALVCSRMSWRSTASLTALCCFASLLVVGIAANAHFFTIASGGSLSQPFLPNYDAKHAWNTAMFILNDAPFHHTSPSAQYYGMFIAAQMKLTHVSIIVPMAFNFLFILFTILLSGDIAVKALSGRLADRSNSWIAACAIIATGSVCALLQTGAFPIKDASVCLATTLIISGLLDLAISPRTGIDRFIGGALLMSIVRPQYIFVMALGSAIMLLPWSKASAAGRTRYRLCIAAICVAICIIAYYLSVTRIFAVNPPKSVYVYDYTNQAAWTALMGTPETGFSLRHFILLPLSLVLQFLVPFPWNFTRDTVFGPSQLYAHIAYPWYIIVGLVIFYLLRLHRKGFDCPVNRCLMFAMASYVFTAIAYYGLYSRYVLPIIPALIPAAVYIIATSLKTRPFRIWATAYCVIMAATLITCHYLQMRSLNML